MSVYNSHTGVVNDSSNHYLGNLLKIRSMTFKFAHYLWSMEY